MWKNRNVLVTGATGLLGGHMVQALNLRDANIVCLVRDYIPRSRFYTEEMLANEVTGDVEDLDFVRRVINEYKIQTVFHLAAQTQVGIANKDPLPTLRTNIMGTVNVLEACRMADVPQVIVASSDKAYGYSPYLPYDENSPLQGRYPYDVSKSCADLIAQMYREAFYMGVCITRCGNLFGPGDINLDRLIPGTIHSLLMEERPVIRSDGFMLRDYFYVKDAVGAYLSLAEAMFEGSDSFAAYNFSYGEPLTVLQMVDKITRLMGCDPERFSPVIQNKATNEIPRQFLNSNRALGNLDWKPSWNMDTALQETIEWYRENL